MVLTGASFVHKDYLKMFSETVPWEIHEMIDRKMNCEDLAINVMVGDYLARIGMPQPSAVFVAHKTPIQYIANQASKLTSIYAKSLKCCGYQEKYDVCEVQSSSFFYGQAEVTRQLLCT